MTSRYTYGMILHAVTTNTSHGEGKFMPKQFQFFWNLGTEADIQAGFRGIPQSLQITVDAITLIKSLTAT